MEAVAPGWHNIPAVMAAHSVGLRLAGFNPARPCQVTTFVISFVVVNKVMASIIGIHRVMIELRREADEWDPAMCAMGHGAFGSDYRTLRVCPQDRSGDHRAVAGVLVIYRAVSLRTRHD